MHGEICVKCFIEIILLLERCSCPVGKLHGDIYGACLIEIMLYLDKGVLLSRLESYIEKI